jgi:hypothetical protein
MSIRCSAILRRSVLSSRLAVVACAVVLAGLAGCASAPAGPPVEAPALAVGDHWQYRIIDNLRRGAVSTLDMEVIAVTGGFARIRIDRADEFGHSESIEEVDRSGGLRYGAMGREAPRPFDPPAILFAFPLEQGKTWREVINTFRKDTELNDQILIYGRIDGRAALAVPAGTFDAVYVYRIVQLDDEEFWRSRTTRRDAVWYSPQIKAPVREAREAEYTERSSGPDMAIVRTESTVLELVSFRPATR